MLTVQSDAAVRELAVKNLKKKRDFHAHLLVYLLVNTALVVIWALSDRHGFFWPVFFIAFWGIGVIMNAWDVYHGEGFRERQIQREIDRLSSH